MLVEVGVGEAVGCPSTGVALSVAGVLVGATSVLGGVGVRLNSVSGIDSIHIESSSLVLGMSLD